MDEAWDCDLFFVPDNLEYDEGIDEEDSDSDWQVIALDRFADRRINSEY